MYGLNGGVQEAVSSGSVPEPGTGVPVPGWGVACSWCSTGAAVSMARGYGSSKAGAGVDGRGSTYPAVARRVPRRDFATSIVTTASRATTITTAEVIIVGVDQLGSGLVTAALRCVGKVPGVMVLDVVGVAEVSSAMAASVEGVEVGVGEEGVASGEAVVSSASEGAAADGESDAGAASVGEDEADAVWLSVGQGESDAVGVEVAGGESDAVGAEVAGGDSDALGVGVAESDGVGVAVKVGVADAVGEGDSDVGVGVGEGASEVGVAVGVSEGGCGVAVVVGASEDGGALADGVCEVRVGLGTG
jgi:hypothetical protein